MKIRVGFGYDVHALVPDRELWLGGIKIEHTLGLLGHSDADGYELGNIDATVAAERPKLNPHIPLMKKTLAEVMNVDEEDISIKATTTEKLGFTGRQEGISAYATVLIQRMGS